jgi:hypothetical protein
MSDTLTIGPSPEQKRRKNQNRPQERATAPSLSRTFVFPSASHSLIVKRMLNPFELILVIRRSSRHVSSVKSLGPMGWGGRDGSAVHRGLRGEDCTLLRPSGALHQVPPRTLISGSRLLGTKKEGGAGAPPSAPCCLV